MKTSVEIYFQICSLFSIMNVLHNIMKKKKKNEDCLFFDDHNIRYKYKFNGWNDVV